MCALAQYRVRYSRDIVICTYTFVMEWTTEAKDRLKEIPFFVRPGARKKIEKLAQEMGVSEITAEVYEKAKEKFG